MILPIAIAVAVAVSADAVLPAETFRAQVDSRDGRRVSRFAGEAAGRPVGGGPRV